MKKNLDAFILKYCLQNAIFYNGKADVKAVLGKIIATQPGLRKDLKRIKANVEKMVKLVNSYSLEKQKKMLCDIAPELLEKERDKKQDLPELKGAVKGKVVTRFAPAPTGPLHIFHLLRAAFLSYLYAKKYKGRFILRLEDTDPRRVERKFYEWIKEDLKAVGIEWDEMILESDNMEVYYQFAERLISNGKAYICFCSAKRFRRLKIERKCCDCRKNDIVYNIKEWKRMLEGEYKEGDAVVRFKTSMDEKNPALRDPPLLRIIDAFHPLKGNKYHVWPLYNYACAIEDHISGITHIFRAKEHEHNTAIQKLIYDAFKWNMPEVINFGMIYLPGEKIHTRIIKERIKTGFYTGWDDIRLPTVRAFLRRGFHPKTFKELAKTCGLTKTDVTLSMENLEGINRKIIDPVANRYMVVINPVRISIINSPKMQKITIKKHPDFPERGEKIMPFDPKEVYISQEDFENLKDKEFRLIGLGNIRLKKGTGYYIGNKIVRNMKKIQWVSVPSNKIIILTQTAKLSGLGEYEMKRLKVGEIIQMNRIGFGRVDKKHGKKIIIAFAHK